MNVFYSDAYVAAEHDFCTTRKASWIAESLRHTPIEGVIVTEPEPLAYDALLAVHDREYVEAVLTGMPESRACSQGFAWGPQLLPSLLASSGGVVAAARHALTHGVSGSLSSGLHHARRGWGLGFCTFNGLVLAAIAALEAGAGRVLILDLDAHCGGGTASLIGGEPRIRQVDVSVCEFDTYRSTSAARLVMADGETYLDAVGRALDECVPGEFGLCIYNAGMDPFGEDTSGGAPGITVEALAAREGLVFDWARRSGLPIAFVLAGGYVGGNVDRAKLVALHRMTIRAAAMAA
jgi:acetoin utilization deacetylase AcuC-like enzyme